MSEPKAPPPTTVEPASQTKHDRSATATTTMMNVQLQILHEMQQLNELNRKIHGQPPLKSKELWNFLLQVFGLLAASIFGVFAILAWKAADRANQMADYATDLASSANALASSGNQVAKTARDDASVANMLAIWERCEATPTLATTTTGTAAQTSTLDPCGEVLSVLSEQNALYRFAESYFNLTRAGDATPTPTPTQGPPTSGASSGDASSASPGLIAGAVVGSIAGCALLLALAYLPYQTYRAQMRRAREVDAALKNEKS